MECASQIRLNRLILIVCSLGLFIDGYLLYISSIALPFINQVFLPTDIQLGVVQSAAPIGAALGAICIGRLSDHIGRKSMLIINLVFFVIISMACSLAWDMTSLIVLRFLVGFGVGMDYPICAAYMAEMTPKEKSGKFMAIAMLVNCLASPIGVLIAWGLYSVYPELGVWRLMFMSCVIPAILGLILRARLPESTLWKTHKNINIESKEKNKNYKELFSKKYLLLTFCFCSIWFLMDIAYYGIGLFTPIILESLHVSASASFLDSAGDLIRSTLYVNIFVVLGAWASIWAIQKMNNILLQKIGFFVSFAGLFILAFSFTSSHFVNMSLIFTGFIIFNFFVNLGPGITTYSLPAQYYPTHLRATGHGLAAGIAKVGAFIGTMFLPLMVSHLGVYISVALISLSLLFGFILSFFIKNQEVNLEI
ncbi:MFS transporter [Francisella halioticida]|uniref:MFS transporter n=1 Tax=Francisella halioticida TaxID=549298 RepID=A0ABM6LY91_9GAMM|nr:MFS transporter [Francisella halioticida]ASG67440.1 MFS transporter [Francisella halioticida]